MALRCVWKESLTGQMVASHACIVVWLFSSPPEQTRCPGLTAFAENVEHVAVPRATPWIVFVQTLPVPEGSRLPFSVPSEGLRPP